MRLLAILFILLSFHIVSFCNVFDSLFLKISETSIDSIKARLFYEIGSEYIKSKPDSALNFFNKSIKISIKKIEHENFSFIYANSLKSIAFIYCNYFGKYDTSLVISNKAIVLFTKLSTNSSKNINRKSRIGIAECYSNNGNVNFLQSNYTEALENFKKALSIAEELFDMKNISSCYNYIGNVFTNQGNYSQAIEYYLRAVKFFEEINNKRGMANCYGNIGNLHFYLKNYELAHTYYNNSLAIFNEISDKKGIGNILICIGNSYLVNKKYNSAIENFQKALRIFGELGSKSGMSFCYNNIGLIYKTLEDYNQALFYYAKSEEICSEIGDKSSLALIYNNKAEINTVLKQYFKAIENAEKSLEISEKNGLILEMQKSYVSLSLSYDGLGEINNAFKFYKLSNLLKDSLFNIEKSKQFTEMETKYQTEKKQQEIEKQSLEIGKHQAEIKQQTTQKYAFIIGFLLMLLVAGFAIYSFIIKRKANKLLSQKNTEIEQKNDEITAQRDEIEAQRNQVVSQKEQLQHIHTELTDSIYYAERIQRAVLPDFENLTGFQNLSGLNIETFILFKPKDIVAGDFYWATRVDKWTILCVADCTGHGVPGAFMSMLGISFLNEIVRKNEVTQANHVLNHLRKYVIQSLQQRGVSGEQKDGMDVALCVIDSQNNLLQYSGANNSLYLICDKWSHKEFGDGFKTAEIQNCVLHEIKPDKMPVAIYEQMPDFTNNIIKLSNSDRIYLFSDGFADQFGGPKGKKYLSKHFKEEILNSCELSITEQKVYLEDSIKSWINYKNPLTNKSYEQTDDICVMGIEFKTK